MLRKFSIILALVFMFGTTVNANFNEADNQSIITSIVQDIISGDAESFRNKSSYFSSNTYEKLKDYVESNTIGSMGISEIVVDRVEPDNSFTGDVVLMTNVKLTYEGYNKLYLFEFHVNADGVIYGYNIWQY